MPDQPRASGAVFLSYAREDGEAARRIAEALRAFGVEVWFDVSELRGGDAWDQKIRRQIRECALFIPLISAHSQAREEGYFRREWKMAVDRTHDMAENRAFIVPVLIDATRESDANVPEQFLKAHCTRLPDGEPTPQFVEQVKRLLQAPRAGEAGTRSAAPRAAQPAAGAPP
ncbi:MAG TPA: toll/interleukin-1 receptor domain-containing protein, partial [Lacunisphaera sp.]|nr:toll/interleukin-1 receptor domain-containing protein [Lacunisphaera sp.]